MSEITKNYSYHDDLPPEQRSRFRDVCYEVVNSITDAVETYDRKNEENRAKVLAHITGLTDRSEKRRQQMIAAFKGRMFPVTIPLRTFDRTDYNERKIEKNLRRFLTEGCSDHFDESQEYSSEIQPDTMCMEIATMDVEDKGYKITLMRNTEYHTKANDGTILPGNVAYLLVIDPMVYEQAPIPDSLADSSLEAAVA